MWDLASEATTTGLAMLALTVVLSAAVGAEREFRQKAAGLRTHVLVGAGSATFTLVSAYGFASVVDPGTPNDPARIAAQVVTGIGFIGAGVVFNRGHVVRGLTTAASIWLVAAIGMAAGAGLPILAIGATAVHFLTVLVLAPLELRMPTADRDRMLEVRYEDGKGALRTILEAATDMGFEAAILSSSVDAVPADDGERRVVDLRARFTGKAPQHDLIQAISALPGVLRVSGGDDRDDHY